MINIVQLDPGLRRDDDGFQQAYLTRVFPNALAPVGILCPVTQFQAATHFIFIPVAVVFIGFGLEGPPAAIGILREPAGRRGRIVWWLRVGHKLVTNL
jgi:hypothetical protein